jgi:SAM-dependent methyltransferase
MGAAVRCSGRDLSCEVHQQELARLYDQRFSVPGRRAKARVWQVLVTQLFQQFIRCEDTVLDLGCGYGEFLNAVRCARRIGVDLNREAEDFLLPDVEFHAAPVHDLHFLNEATVDVVFSSNVLEHLPDKTTVEMTLREVRRVLRPGGSVLLMGPNVRLLPGEYWDFWDHMVPITDRSLVELLRTLGFRIERQIPRFLPYTTRSALPQAPALVRWYLAMPLAWRVFGRQFFIHARAPAR